MSLTPQLIAGLRRTESLEQRVLAERSGVSGSALSVIESGQRNPTLATVNSIVRALGYQAVLVPTLVDTIATLTAVAGEFLRQGDTAGAGRAFFQANDNLFREADTVRVALTVTPPPLTGSKRWDAAFAGLVRHHLNARHLPLPPWLEEPRRFLSRPWTFSLLPRAVPVKREEAVPDLLVHGVVIHRDALESY